MLRSNFFVSSAVLIAIIGSVAAIGYQRWKTTLGSVAPQPVASKMEAIRVAPGGDPNAEVECAALDWVNFTYKVRNRGDAPITGLKIGTKCSCEEVGDPPAVIMPEESTSISFKLRAPRVGRLQRKIPLIVEGANQPLALLDVALRVKFTPPALISPTQDLTVKLVAGDSSPHEVLLEAIEAKRASPWIGGLVLDPSEGIEVQQCRTEELPEADATLTRRRYSFPLVNRSLPAGKRTVIATVRTRDGSPTVKDPVIVWIEVFDPVAVIPNPLVIKYVPGSAPAPRRVCVVDRTGRCALATAEVYDRQLLHIEARGKPGGSTSPFDIAAVNLPDSAVDTQVVFHIGDNETRKLLIRFEPSERP